MELNSKPKVNPIQYASWWSTIDHLVHRKVMSHEGYSNSFHMFLAACFKQMEFNQARGLGLQMGPTMFFGLGHCWHTLNSNE